MRRGWKILLTEIDKLKTVQALGIPEEPFAGVSEKTVAAWRSRAGRKTLRRLARELMATEKAVVSPSTNSRARARRARSPRGYTWRSAAEAVP